MDGWIDGWMDVLDPVCKWICLTGTWFFFFFFPRFLDRACTASKVPSWPNCCSRQSRSRVPRTALWTTAMVEVTCLRWAHFGGACIIYIYIVYNYRCIRNSERTSEKWWKNMHLSIPVKWLSVSTAMESPSGTVTALRDERVEHPTPQFVQGKRTKPAAQGEQKESVQSDLFFGWTGKKHVVIVRVINKGLHITYIW